MKKIKVRGPIVSNDMGWIYDWIGWDAAYPRQLEEALEEAAGDDVVIEINSPGGVCIYGYEMYTAIKNYEGKVTVHVISAMSAATLLVCAADEALISDTGIFMIHNAQSSAQGDYRNMQMEADALKEFNAGIINAYVKKTGKTREEIQNLMDNDSYMSPQTAIEQGFIDGYMFGDPNSRDEQTKKDVINFANQVVAAEAGQQIIPEDKAMEIMQALKLATSQKQDMQNIGEVAVSDKDKKNEGGKAMTLTEFLAENPEAKAEMDAATAQARKEGANAERERMQSLDAIAKTVSPEALNEAKYGEKPIDGPTLAYQALAKGDMMAAAYMAEAIKDSKDSKAPEIGIGTPDAGEEQDNEADEMASYVNAKRGGK